MSLEGDDYTVEPFSGDFTATEYESADSICRNISLHEDILSEEDETIEILINTADSFVTLTQDRAIVTIHDVVTRNMLYVSFFKLCSPILSE